MNSLNILSSRVAPPSAPSRSKSFASSLGFSASTTSVPSATSTSTSTVPPSLSSRAFSSHSVTSLSRLSTSQKKNSFSDTDLPSLDSFPLLGGDNDPSTATATTFPVSESSFASSPSPNASCSPLPSDVSQTPTNTDSPLAMSSTRSSYTVTSAEPSDLCYAPSASSSLPSPAYTPSIPPPPSSTAPSSVQSTTSWHQVPKKVAISLVSSVHWVLSTLAAPGVYLWACMCNFGSWIAPWSPWRLLFGSFTRSDEAHTQSKQTATTPPIGSEKPRSRRRSSTASSRKGALPPTIENNNGFSTSLSPMTSSSTTTSAASRRSSSTSSTASRTHSRAQSTDDTRNGSVRRSIRIKENQDEALRQRKHRKSSSNVYRPRDPKESLDEGSSTGADYSHGSDSHNALTPDLTSHLKSPTSPLNGLTKYPRLPGPPRPLIPRRQPSYVNLEMPDTKHKKTLILDLDETLIHSMSKGVRTNTGHMVEVRLNTSYVDMSGQTTIGPQHPILYYVHKRPHCDEFLRRVYKWFNLVVFTASVQEYADPVIDWLEEERKFFSNRLYRQHCTYRQGAFIKDLSTVEPDLSKVMILDNSPLSYLFHQDNAIPIQGWISDPTDSDLLHLVPFLEGLQYVSDVRALLALRGGEDSQHVA